MSRILTCEKCGKSWELRGSVFAYQSLSRHMKDCGKSTPKENTSDE